MTRLNIPGRSSRSGWVRVRTLGLATLPLVLAGCASLSGDGGLKPVQQAAEQHLGKTVQVLKSEADQNAVGDRVGELLAKPLSADSAVQIALLNNRGLQASFQELGIAEAELVQASRLPNPGFRLRSSGAAMSVRLNARSPSIWHT